MTSPATASRTDAATPATHISEDTRQTKKKVAAFDTLARLLAAGFIKIVGGKEINPRKIEATVSSRAVSGEFATEVVELARNLAHHVLDRGGLSIEFSVDSLRARARQFGYEKKKVKKKAFERMYLLACLQGLYEMADSRVLKGQEDGPGEVGSLYFTSTAYALVHPIQERVGVIEVPTRHSTARTDLDKVKERIEQHFS